MSAPGTPASDLPAADAASLRRVTRVAVLAAVALALSYVETTIPLPLVFPGAKLGLANIAVLVALFAYGPATAVSVAVVKVLAAGFIFGSPLMMAYSLGGTTLALLGMLGLSLVPGISVTIVSMVSAVLHNTGQVLVACAMLGTPAVLLSLPPLALIALITGALTGVVAAAVLAEVGEGAAAPAGDGAASAGVPSAPKAPAVDPGAFGAYRPGDTIAHRLDPRVKIVFVILFFVAAFVASGPIAFAVLLLGTVVAMRCSGAGVGRALGWLRPFWGLFLFVAVFDVLFTRDGEVLWAAGVVTLTTGGLAFAAESVLRFACMALGTSSLMATTSPEALTAGVGGLLAPLRRLGLHTDNAVLALSLTLQFLPVVAGEFAAARAAASGSDPSGNDTSSEAEGEHGPARLSAALRDMRSFGLAFAPAFASALRRADDLALELAQDPSARAVSTGESLRALRPLDWGVLAASLALAVVTSVLSLA